MKLEKLAELIIETLEDNKATNIQTLDIRDISSFADLMIIASGTSSKQVTSIAEKVIENAKKNKVPPYGTEGKQYGEWVLVDLGDIIVHIMHPTTRAHYQLEKLWAPVDDAQSLKQTAH
ncbi:MAG: ribosome silencing factor [Proteobacteria bacterium]|nr:ribosome silencing factor [Pseudomonadota bacterium]